MIESIGWILLFGLFASWLLERFKLPRLLGMMMAGMFIGPYGLNLLNPNFLVLSDDIRKMALVIILIRAGLKLSASDLRHIGRPALLLGFVPAAFEIMAVTFVAPLLLNISYIEALLMGSVLGAVSPAVIVPKMIRLIDQDYGTQRGIPQMILASSTFDDLFVIVLFTTMLPIAQGQSLQLEQLIQSPLSIIAGIIIGLFVGLCLSTLFKQLSWNKTATMLFLLSVSFLLLWSEKQLSALFSFSAFIAILVLGIVIRHRQTTIAIDLSQSFNHLWEIAEIFLFVLLGSAISIHHLTTHSMVNMSIIGIALLCRIIGVMLSLCFFPFSWKERLFCAISFLPKATVQAAIGGIPLSLGLASGQFILTLAALSIFLTAPLGALLIDYLAPKCLTTPQ